MKRFSLLVFCGLIITITGFPVGFCWEADTTQTYGLKLVVESTTDWMDITWDPTPYVVESQYTVTSGEESITNIEAGSMNILVDHDLSVSTKVIVEAEFVITQVDGIPTINFEKGAIGYVKLDIYTYAIEIQGYTLLESYHITDGPDSRQLEEDLYMSPLASEKIFYNGIILTMDENQPQADAVYVKDGIIMDIGTDEEILVYEKSQTEMINLDGRTMLPGFIDAHEHRLNDYTEVDSKEEAVEMAIRNGFTTITPLYTDPDMIEEILELDQAGLLRLRVNLFLSMNRDYERMENWVFNYTAKELLSPKVKVLGVKMFADGGTKYQTAAMREPYANDPYNMGNKFFYWTELELLVSRAHEAGFQIAIHAIGDAAIDQVLSVYENVLGAETNEEYRHRIEHLYFITDDLIERMAEKGIIASFQNNWASSDFVQFHTKIVGEERATWNGRWRDLLDSGTPCVASTDYPNCWLGSPSIAGIYTSVTRLGLRWETPIPGWMLEQRLSVEEALRLMTIDAAYATFQEETTGSIITGKFADLVVLSDNPLEMDPMDLMDLKIWMTVIQGKIEFWKERDETYTLTISREGPGSTEPPPSSYDYQGGFDVKVQSIAEKTDGLECEFIHWLLDGTPHKWNTITVNMNQDHELVAVFEEIEHYGDVEITVSDESGNPVSYFNVTTVDKPAEQTEVADRSSRGSVDFDDLIPGSYVFNITIKGYRETSISVEVLADQTTMYSHQLTTEDKIEEVVEDDNVKVEDTVKDLLGQVIENISEYPVQVAISLAVVIYLTLGLNLISKRRNHPKDPL